MPLGFMKLRSYVGNIAYMYIRRSYNNVVTKFKGNIDAGDSYVSKSDELI